MENAPDSNSSRRHFLRRLGLGVAGVSTLLPAVTASPLTQSSFPMLNNTDRKLGWALVGLGKFATQQLMPAFKDCKKSKLVALVSGDSAKAQRLAAEYELNPKNIYNYQNYDSLGNNPEVDVIYIVLPNGMHAEYTVRGARASKHVMCEKPMANTPKECQQMIDACRQANRKLMIAYRAQYEPFNLKAIELVRSGELGRIKMINADHGRILDPSDKADVWRMDKKLAGGGSLMDIGIYSLQATRYLTGEEPVAVSALQYSTPAAPRFREVEESVTFQLQFPGGVLAVCTSSYGYQDTKRYRVLGDKAWLNLDPATDYYRHEMTIGREGKEEKIQLKEGNQFAAEMDHFSECILENKTPKTPGEEGLQDVKIMMAIYEAARTGKTVKL